jgi:DNA mismatch endonuclease Vsr
VAQQGGLEIRMTSSASSPAIRGTAAAPTRTVQMVDTVAPTVRSRMMSAVKGMNTKPELEVRRALHGAGFRYRLHRRDLPGRPDIAIRRFKVAAFVHGCFWHGHGCPRGRRPTSNTEFWTQKLDGNLTAASSECTCVTRALILPRHVRSCSGNSMYVSNSL